MSDQIFRFSSPLMATRVVAARLQVSTAAISSACNRRSKLRELQEERDQLTLVRQRPQGNVISVLPRLKDRYEALMGNLPAAVAKKDPERARALLQQLPGGLHIIRRKDGLAAEAMLTGERLAAFGGLSCTGGAGGGT
jgi:hypothetical protein